VEAFLDRRIGFTQIAEVVEETLSRVPSKKAATIDEVIAIDQASRATARQIVTRKSAKPQ
jgi:1-deoxy-D-xylulose-5-phosphate reductoisomerase